MFRAQSLCPIHEKFFSFQSSWDFGIVDERLWPHSTNTQDFCLLTCTDTSHFGE